ncbi:MAG: hypothetical protein NTV63_01855 [Candidatus Woesearchaeota archaeon]|nr:hypothetical protein [Candidatus Woesearchaeota archaeon]
MKLMFVKIKKVNVRGFIPPKNTANFEVFYEDQMGSHSFTKNLVVERNAVPAIIRTVIELEERANYDKETGTIDIVVEDKDLAKEKLLGLISDILMRVSKLDKNKAGIYLQTISAINRITLAL